MSRRRRAPPTARPSGRSARRAAVRLLPRRPDLASFPRALWLRALRDVLRSAPDGAFAYPDARGAPRAARRADAPTCGACAASSSSRSRSSSAPARRRGSRCSDARSSRRGMSVDRRRGSRPAAAPRGARLRRHAGARARPSTSRAWTSRPLRCAGGADDAGAPVPDGRRALAARARGELVDWARDGGLVIEDDYDAEFRYDRAPLGALQGLAPDRVVYWARSQRRSRRGCASAGWCCRRR